MCSAHIHSELTVNSIVHPAVLGKGNEPCMLYMQKIMNPAVHGKGNDKMLCGHMYGVWCNVDTRF